MATTAEQLKRLQREVKALKKKVAELERRTNGKRRVTRTPTRELVTPRRVKSATDEHTRVDEILRRAGMLSELTPKEKAMVAEWEAVPAEERQRISEEFYNLKLDKPLSDIIIENRR